ncbi:hypothetical protein WS62_31255 [Burkholderia sp. ABCPW 14]|uniref:DUF3644 domain-containing protein n=1 Tax=Burkholderia sp. ABCPW 14 TaxID=1637860 RepID=UPI000770C07C|nr:DUF3644 domain-containing protein [Burkholderia sp. ABCPW 14]KVD77000.1 hypothetical protein WS62_31255 [Burkholderia sp. ABCPW 14]
MSTRNRTVGSLALELLAKSREAALCAIRAFNDPHTSFKSETFIVLMVIAWTYLLHAHYRRKRVEYRYFTKEGARRKFDRTKRGAFRYWELERCLNEKTSPIDKDTANNLRFLVGLRHEIEHQMTRSLDNFLSGRYQACSLNYNEYVKKLFGKRHGLDSYLTYSIQFIELSEEQVSGTSAHGQIPERLRAYVAEFDAALTHDEYNNPRYSYRLLFKKKLVNKAGQADRVIEFIDPNSELAKTIDKEYWVKKDVERAKYLPTRVVEEIRKAGFQKFRVQPDHVNMWRSEDAKNPSKGYGVQVEGAWYWYESWIKRCIELCKAAGDKYT